MYRWIQTFTVIAKHTGLQYPPSFPTDMLRYDACYPSTQDDVVAMGSRSGRPVTLTRIIRYKDQRPRSERWESFGWLVLHDSVYTRRLD